MSDADMDDTQAVAEATDADKLDDRDDAPDDVPADFPPDRPLAVNEDAIEPSAAESVAARTRREEPDPLVEALEREAADREDGGSERSEAEELLDELDVPVPDGELDEELVEVLVGDEEFDEEGRTLAPLIDPTPEFDDEPQAVALEGDDIGEESAEEAAMHIEPEPS